MRECYIKETGRRQDGRKKVTKVHEENKRKRCKKEAGRRQKDSRKAVE